jgi:hypothetical protein
VREIRAARVAALASIVAGVAVLASTAQANEYQLTEQVASRGDPHASFDSGYRGPVFYVTSWGETSTDTYDCPSQQVASNWVVVPDVPKSIDRAWWASTDLGKVGRHRFVLNVTNWSTAFLSLRLVATCTNDPSTYPYPPPTSTGVRPYGQYHDYWVAQFPHSLPPEPPVSAYPGLIQRAFCWIATTPGCSGSGGLGVGRGGKRVAVRNGKNEIPLTFDHPAKSQRPPAVRLSSPAGCRAKRMPLSVQDGAGQLTLVLRCHGLDRHSTGRVRIANAVRTNFRLRRGAGSVSVRLAKPPGRVAPYAFVSYGRTNTQCKHVHDRLRLHRRTLGLKVTTHCGRTAGNATGHLDVGGLLAARR